MENGIKLARAAAGILDDNKADDIKIINVRQQVGITDYFIIATGKSRPHIKFLSHEIKNKLQQNSKRTPHISEGEPEQGWLLLDYEEVIVHIFTQEKRDYYNLEGLWADAPVVQKQA